MIEASEPGSRGKSGRASRNEMPIVSSQLPFLIPSDKAKTIRDLGRDLKPIIGFEVKGQKYLISIIESITEYLASSIEALSESEPDKAKMIANTLKVPIVISIEGRKEHVTQKVPLRQILELKAKQLGDHVVNSYKKKFESRISVKREKEVEDK